MPIRSTRPRKDEGLRKFIPMLYEQPELKYLKLGEPWEHLADLIYGPPTSFPDAPLIANLRKLWRELGADIIAAQEHYQPDKKPWGARFDG